ncbi:MAG: hypothetical protein ACJA1O_003128 [Spirosomataceae bacterium]|jgi:hypothetical protein
MRKRTVLPPEKARDKRVDNGYYLTENKRKQP